MQAESRRATPLIFILAAFATVYVVWGSTYLAIRFAIETLPPFLMAGVRFVIAGLVLYALVRPRQSAAPTRANWVAAGIVGSLMLVGGNGLVCWAEQYIPSGLAALLIATVPAWMILLHWLFFAGPRPTRMMVLGLAGGLFGIYLLIGPGNFGGGAMNLAGSAGVLFACLFWCVGSLYSRQARLPRSAFLAAAMEMILGGAALLLVGTAAGEWPRVDLSGVSAKSLLALAYLVVLGSILALTAYVWLLTVVSPARVSTYAYVNPVIAVCLGALLANEPLTPRVLIAGAVIIGSVVVVTLASGRSAARDTQEMFRKSKTAAQVEPIMPDANAVAVGSKEGSCST